MVQPDDYNFTDILGYPPDSRVKHWTLMGSPIPTFIIIGIYLLLVLQILPQFMKKREPYPLTQLIRCYNLFQVVSCISLIYMILTAGWLQGEHNLGCTPIDYSSNPNPVKMVGAFYWLYCLKGVELLETIFFALRKKFDQISGLHVYHHCSTFFIAWVGCKFLGGGMASIHIILNSFIHILMYTYYYMSSLGPTWQQRLKLWKPKLTMCQMIQFTIMIGHSLLALQPSCPVPKQFVVIYIPNVIVIFKMFSDFYTKNYSTSKTKSSVNTGPLSNNNIKKIA